jgi:hypothetical protein
MAAGRPSLARRLHDPHSKLMTRLLVLLIAILAFAGLALVAGGLLGLAAPGLEQAAPRAQPTGAPAAGRVPNSAPPPTNAPPRASAAPQSPNTSAPTAPTATRGVAAATPPGAPAGGATTAGAAGEVALEVDEATLTRQANAALAGQPVGDTPLGQATLRQITVQLRDGKITTTGTAQVGATTLPLEVVGTVDAAGGQLRVAVSSVRIGGFPLPTSVSGQVEQALQAQVNQTLAGQSIRIRSVAIANGKLTVVGARA